MSDRIPVHEVYSFLIKNGLVQSGYSEHIGATEKGRRLLDYLGFAYDYESVMRYIQVFRVVPEEHKDAVKLVTNKDEIGRNVLHFQWVHTIIVPIRYNDGNPVPQKLLNELRQEFVRHFGGVTRFTASGDFLSSYGLQKDKCEVWDGFGTDDNYRSDRTFLQKFAIKVGSKNFCNQDAVTISEQPRKIEIIETLDMEQEITHLSNSRLFSLRSMVILAAIAGTGFSEQNRHTVANVAGALGFDGW